MNNAKQQFLRTTRLYFSKTNQQVAQIECSPKTPHSKIYYIKEGPFINPEQRTASYAA